MHKTFANLCNVDYANDWKEEQKWHDSVDGGFLSSTFSDLSVFGITPKNVYLNKMNDIWYHTKLY